MVKIAITGTPGVGKTTVARILARKLKYKLIKIDELADRLNAYLGYDKKRRSKILNMKKLREEVEKNKENIVLEGHVSHEFPVDVVIVFRCNPELIQKRLKKRYPDIPIKVKENVESEVLGVITSEAIMRNKNIYEIDTTSKTPEETTGIILKILRGETEDYRAGKIDWLSKYQHLINP